MSWISLHFHQQTTLLWASALLVIWGQFCILSLFLCVSLVNAFSSMYVSVYPYLPDHLNILIRWLKVSMWALQAVLVVKNPPANAGDIRVAGLVPGLGRSPGGGHGNPSQYSCLENPMDRRPWQATVHGVAVSRMRLSAHTHTHAHTATAIR